MSIEVPIEEARYLDNGIRWQGVDLTTKQHAELMADVAKATKARKYARFTGYKASTGQAELMRRKLAASLGWESQFKGTPATERGTLMEKEARRWLAMEIGKRISEIGFVVSGCGRYGASPDGITEDGDPVEIKCPELPAFLKCADDGDVPNEYKAQVHGEMLVTGASRCWFVAYADSEYLDNVVIEVKRDDYTEALAHHLDRFCEELDIYRRRHLGDFYDEIFGEEDFAQ